MFNCNECEHEWERIPGDLLLHECNKCGWIVFKSEMDFEVFTWGSTVKRDRKTGQWYSCGGWHSEPWDIAGISHYSEDRLIPKGSKRSDRCEELYGWYWERVEAEMNKCLDYFEENGWDDWCNTLWIRIGDPNLQRIVRVKTGAEVKYPKMGLFS